MKHSVPSQQNLRVVCGCGLLKLPWSHMLEERKGYVPMYLMHMCTHPLLSYLLLFPSSLLPPSQQKSVESIVATLRVLMESSVEELKIVQTILLLVTSTDVVQGKALAKVAREGGKEGGR